MNVARLCTAFALALGGCPVAVEQHGVHGLWTSPSPKRQTPDGALLEADNVSFRRPGMAGPRPGFEAGETVDPLEGSTDSIVGLIPYDGDVLHVIWGDGANVVRSAFPADFFVTLSWDVASHNIRGVEARKNLYLTTTDVVSKITGSSAGATLSQAGMMRPLSTGRATSSTGTNIADQTTVAYRTVARRVVNDQTIRSAPSAISYASNTSGGAKAGSISFRFHASGDYEAGDILEIYRSRAVPFGNPPSGELYLALEHEITAADLTAGATTVTDDTEEADLGRALYTNGSREGIERENIRPPVATDLALFQGSLFASNITYPQKLNIVWSEGGTLLAGSADGIGARIVTGTRTNGSDVITGLSDTSGIEVGQLLAQDSGWSGTEYVRITAINGSDVTMSETWNGATDGAPVNCSFADSIRIESATEDLYFPAYYAVNFMQSIAFTDLAFRGGASTSTLYHAYSVGVAQETDDSAAVTGNRRSVWIEGLEPGNEAFEVYATHGDEYEPPLPTPDQANGEPSIQDIYANGLAWSKNEQPDHFMLGARWLVGNQLSPILRTMPTKDALWILKGKGDGIYRLSGFGERSGWRVDPHDTSTYLLHPELATTYGDAVYAWTNNGPVRISDRGVEPIGVEIEDLTRNLEQLCDHTQDNFAFSVANLKDGEVIFGLPDVSDLDNAAAAAQVFVYNVERRVWSQWFKDVDQYTAACYDPSTRLIHLGRLDTGTSRIERAANDNYPFGDRDEALTVSDVTGNRVTLSATYPYGVGSLIWQSSSAYGIVTNVVSSAVVDVDDGSRLSAAAGFAVEAFTSRLTWIPKVGANAASVKRFDSAVLSWDDAYGVYTWDVEFSGQPFAGSPLTRTATRTLTRSSERDMTRHHVDRSVAKNNQLYVSVELTQADARWRIDQMSLWSQVISRRVSR